MSKAAVVETQKQHAKVGVIRSFSVGIKPHEWIWLLHPT